MHSSGKTDTGIKRNNNQDSIFFSDTPVGPLPNLYIVADGMGGHRAGDKASRMAIDITVDFIEKSTIENPVALLKRAMLFVNNEIYKAACADPDLNGMGTTMVAAVAQDGKAYYYFERVHSEPIVCDRRRDSSDHNGSFACRGTDPKR